ncbi:MAG TPA: tetratricopeptide repeat protein [Chloroflexia bacterium]|jgi:predicted ATPase/DNA-binding XRE family transcriptional regulator
MSDPNLFAQTLRDRRKALRLTQTELAARTGLSFSAVQKLEGGQRRPSQQVTELLVEALKIPPRERARFMDLALAPPGVESANTEQAHPPNNLPAQLTPLIGRDDVLESVTALVESDKVRLLTLTGPPGIGKTRLAVEAATALLPGFADGVFLVPLAPLRDPTLVVGSIAAVFGVRDKSTEPLSLTLKEYLREQKVLLVLDNFEQVVEAARAVADLMWGCPQVKMLVTSREALHVRGERQFPVPSLDGDASVQLFAERAREVEAGFSITPENRSVVEGICAHLEGLPLAIELVAARVRLMPPKPLLARLESRSAAAGGAALPLLVGGARDLPERHRTLRSAIGWSYELLNPAEQRLYRRLGVFVGGCTTAAAQAVCNARDDLGIDVADGLLSLLDKNLLKRQDVAGGAEEPRYVMLETIREYALERLEESGERDKVKEWHAEYYLALARAAESQITGPNQKQWLQTLEDEHDNLRGALGWTLERGEVEMGLRIASGVWRFWYMHSHMEEGLRWFDLLLRKAEGSYVAPSLLIGALNDAGALAMTRSEYDRAGDWLNRSLALARQEGEPQSIASALNRLGTLMGYSGKHELGMTLLREGLVLQRGLGDKAGMARTYNNLASMAQHLGDLDEAASLYAESLSSYRELEDRWSQAMVLGNLGHAVRRQGDYERAARFCDQSLDLGADLDSTGVLVMLTRTCQGDIARCQGRYEQARELYGVALQSSMKFSYDYFTGLVLLGLAALYTQKNEAERAVDLLGALESLIEKGGGALILPVDRPDYEQTLATARGALDAGTFHKAWERGRTMPFDSLMAYALG